MPAVALTFSPETAARLQQDEEARRYVEALAEALLGEARIESAGMSDEESFAYHRSNRYRGEEAIFGGLMALQADAKRRGLPVTNPWPFEKGRIK